jgi:hypothetical protein
MLTALEKIALQKSVPTKALKMARGEIAVGSHEVDFTLHIKGTVQVEADTSKVSTVSVPLKETMAFLIRRMGITREAAKKALVEAMQDAIKETSRGEGSILESHPEIAEALEQVNLLMKELPMTPVKGDVTGKFVLEKMEVVS